MPETGDLVLIPFPFSDLSRAKLRPVLVISAADHFGDFIALAVTSKPGHFEAVALTQLDMREGILPKPSWIQTDKVFTLNNSLIERRVGGVQDTVLESVLRSLCPRLGSAGE